MFDVTGLIPIKLQKRNGFQGYWYVHPSDPTTCLARTCSVCHETKSADNFKPDKNVTCKLFSRCNPCDKTYKAKWDQENGAESHKKNRERHKARTTDQIAEDQARLRPDGMKRCYKCAEDLPVTLYSTSIGNPDGLTSMCRICDNLYNQENVAQRKARTPQEVAAARAAIRPEGAKWCYKCKADHSLTSFYNDISEPDGLAQVCSDCMKAYQDEYHKKEFEDYWQANGIPLTCYVCGAPYEHNDHVIPSILGGTDDPENRLPMCAHHNTSKNGTPLLQWLRAQHPERVEEVMTRVLSYGVDPFTSKDIWVRIA